MSGPLGSSQWMYNAGGDFYPTVIDQSLRFDGTSSLSRTPSVAGSLTTWTWSGWVKRGALGSDQKLFALDYPPNDANFHWVGFSSADKLDFGLYPTSATARLTTTQVFRDPSAWYNIVAIWDTTNATADDRLKLYVNGVQITAFSVRTNPTQNTSGFINTTRLHTIGDFNYNAGHIQFFNGYMADTYFIDGTALDPTSFGEFKNGVWIPKAYTGSYGTNGFHLEYNDNANDSSGTGNNWTATNIVAGDYMLDSPTNNFATLNPLDRFTGTAYTISDGNLRLRATTTAWQAFRGSMAVSSGKWYAEARITVAANTGNDFGFALTSSTTAAVWGGAAGAYTIGYNGVPTIFVYNDGVFGGYFPTTPVTGDIVSVALDLDTGEIWYAKNNVWKSGDPSLGTSPSASGLSGTFIPVADVYGANSGWEFNFGQSGFTYTPPNGFLALSTANLPEPSISPLYGASPQDHFNTVTYTGNNGTQSITGVGFQPDFTWIKDRTTAYPHMIFDSIRGASKRLISNTAVQEATEANTQTSFDAGGFSVGDNLVVNKLNDAFVAWNWKASNAASVLNDAGTIDSQVSANPTAGFSIVSYTGTGANATVGHGFDVKPKVVIVKNRDQAGDWCVFHEDMNAVPQDYYLLLNLPNNPINNNTIWNDTAPTTSTFSIGSYLYGNTIKYIAYCFHDVEGYSKFGSYTGNGNPNGPFVYTGFRPAFVMVKRTDSGGEWVMWDNKRSGYNVDNDFLFANTPATEFNGLIYVQLDLTSNGFKMRDNSADTNGSGATYIYMAFAENPFKYANAR